MIPARAAGAVRARSCPQAFVINGYVAKVKVDSRERTGGRTSALTG